MANQKRKKASIYSAGHAIISIYKFGYLSRNVFCAFLTCFEIYR